MCGCYLLFRVVFWRCMVLIDVVCICRAGVLSVVECGRVVFIVVGCGGSVMCLEGGVCCWLVLCVVVRGWVLLLVCCCKGFHIVVWSHGSRGCGLLLVIGVCCILALFVVFGFSLLLVAACCWFSVARCISFLVVVIGCGFFVDGFCVCVCVLFG